MKKKHGGRWTIILFTCVLAVPTVATLMGFYGAELTLEIMRPALAVGTLLGLAHIILRPVLRVITAPLGCLTFGLFGFVIDVGLLYACGSVIEGFTVFSPLYAVLTAFLINAVCAIAAGRK